MNTNISNALKMHYYNIFEQFGATSEGIDWGTDNEKVLLRYKKMANLFEENIEGTLLDVGSGFGGFNKYLKENNFNIEYTGIDIAENMIDWAKNHQAIFKEFICADFLNHKFSCKYDYIICNGILTQKLEATNIDMDDYANKLIKKMYLLSNKGIAFNIMTTKVNFFSNNLYYRNPSELFAYCMSEITPNIKIDHTYLYEYTVYLYK